MHPKRGNFVHDHVLVELIGLSVRVLDGLPRVRAVRKSYTILEARMAYRIIV
jgi:hypothetical protein